MLERLNKLVILLLIIGLIIPASVQAQSASRVVLLSPDLEEFPKISAFLDVRDGRGEFVSGLQAGDVTVLEDGIELSVDGIVELQTGLRVVVALNSGTPLVIRNEEGFSRLDLISTFISGWIGSLGGQYSDDLSFVTVSGEPVRHTADAGEWMTAWETALAEPNVQMPSLDILSRAIDLAGDPAGEPDIGRVVLFITPSFQASMAANIQDMADRATQSGIRIYVLLIDSPSLFSRTSAQELRSMAFQTGGQYGAFSGSEILPNLNVWIEPARLKYQIGYRSQFNTPGTHEIAVRVNTQEGELLTAPLTIDLQLRPPNPIFISLPGQIVRAIPDDAEIALENLEPKQYKIEVLFDFPDSIQRDVVRTILYVNGELAVENNTPPFNVFELDLTRFEASQRLNLKVEAWDELGLMGASIETPIDITIQRPDQGLWTAIIRNGPFLVVGVISLVGAVLVMVLVLAGRVRPRSISGRAFQQARNQDPVTQPLDHILAQEDTLPNRLTQFARRLPTRRLPLGRKAVKEPLAYLVRIGANGEPEAGNIISITSGEVTFGSSPIQATIILDDPAVEELHARLHKNGDGGFYLSDQGSVAGTWINYAPVTNGGVRVEHGDLLHIAKNCFRFTLHKPEIVRKPKVLSLEEKT